MILMLKLLGDTMIFFIDEDSKQLQRISWICLGRYYCATTPSRKNAKLQTLLLVCVNESQKRVVFEYQYLTMFLCCSIIHQIYRF